MNRNAAVVNMLFCFLLVCNLVVGFKFDPEVIMTAVSGLLFQKPFIIAYFKNVFVNCNETSARNNSQPKLSSGNSQCDN